MKRVRFEASRSVFAACLIGCLLAGPGTGVLRAQSEEPAQDTDRFDGRYLESLARDFGRVAASPFHWSGRDFLVLGAAASATAVCLGLDRGIQEWVADHPQVRSSRFSLAVTRLGEGPFLLGLSAALYAGGEIFSSGGLRKTALLGLESYAISGVIVTVFKFVLGRSRPQSGDGPFAFNGFSLKSGEHAFPSGHSSSAFAVATVIAGRSDSTAVGILSYGLAALVALSRVNNNEHWASDVVAGSLLGYFVGRAVLSFHRPASSSRPTLELAPAAGGFSLSLRF